MGVKCVRSENEIYFWDFTIFDDSANPAQYKDYFREVAKQWVFQLEKCPTTGKLHFQGRVNLKKKTRCWRGDPAWKGRTSPTSSPVAGAAGRKAFSYVMKTETRESGPWTDRDVSCFVPTDVPSRDGLRDWQAKTLERVLAQNDRQITFMLDEDGNSGKSKLVRHIVAYHNGVFVPNLCTTAQQMAGYVYDATLYNPEVKRIVVFDIPRSTSAKQWETFAPLIETVKDGWAFDGRNTAKSQMIEPPMVLVSLNQTPPGFNLKKIFTPDKVDLVNF